MPVLPTIQSRGQVGALELPRQRRTPAEVGFKALAGFGETLRRIQEQEQAIDETVRSNRIVLDAADSLDRLDEGIREEAEPENHSALWEQRAGQVKAELFNQESLSGFSPVAKGRLQIDIDNLFSRRSAEARHEGRRRTLDRQVGESKQSLDTLARLASKDRDLQGRLRWETRGFDTIAELVESGAIKESDAPDWVRRFKNRIEKERAGYFATGLQDKLDDLLNQALRNPGNAARYQKEGADLIDNATVDWLAEEKREEVQSNFRNSVWSSGVMGLIQEDPDRTLEELKGGKYDAALNQASLIRLRNEAETEIEKRERAAEAERKAREKEIGKLVGDYQEAKMAGFDWRGPVSEGRLSELARGTEHAAKFENVQAASAALGKFNQQNPLVQEQILREITSGAKTGTEAKFFSTLQAAHEKTKQGLKNDPLTFAIRQRVIPSPPALNLDDPESLRARSRLAGIAEAHYGVPVGPLSDDEATQFLTVLEQQPADGKVAVFQKLKAGLEDGQIKLVASQLAKKEAKVTAHAMGISVERPQTASRILRGLDILRDNPKVAPQGAEMTSVRKTINDALGEAYLHNPEHHAAVSQSAMAIYAFKTWQEKDLSGVFEDDRMTQAVQEAAGGIIELSRGFFGGGSYKIQPPRPGITEDQFFEMVRKADLGGAQGFKADDIIRHGTFESVGEGRYLVRVGPGYIQGERGPFILDLSKLEPGPRSPKTEIEIIGAP